MMQKGYIRRRVVACLATADLGQDASSLCVYGPPSEEKDLSLAMAELVDIKDDEREKYIVEQLKSFTAQEEFTGLADIHPAWLVEALSAESPRIIGIILRYLPSKQVRYIIEHLPKRLKHKLPQLIDSFTVPSPILDIIRTRFERRFVSQPRLKEIEKFDFGSLCYLKRDDIETLFRDLGLQELAMALKGMDRHSLNILFNRLSIKEARALQQRIRSLTDAPASFLREAKYTVLEMNLSEMEPEDLLMELGLNAFARTLQPTDVYMFPVIRQKLEPRLGYMLKRYFDQHVHSNVVEVTERRKELVLERVEALSKAGSIDEKWRQYFAVYEETQVLETEADADGWQEEDRVV